MSKKQRNSGEKGRPENPLSAREILLGAGRKGGKSRIEKYRKGSSAGSDAADADAGSEDRPRSGKRPLERSKSASPGRGSSKSESPGDESPGRGSSKRGFSKSASPGGESPGRGSSKRGFSKSVSPGGESSGRGSSKRGFSKSASPGGESPGRGSSKGGYTNRTDPDGEAPGREKGRYKDSGKSRGGSTSGSQKKRGNRQGRSPSSQFNSQNVAQKDYLREQIRLNKFIAHAGLCSRREADEYIEQGKVKVNGKVVTELGTKVKSSDKVEVDQQKLSLEPFVYILLNKGRDTISTTDDEKDRNTVVDAIEGATGHRVYPVGRLDRNTMGLLILTNDGDLAHRLMHPSYKVKKTYEVTTSVLLTDDQLIELRGGITLEEGPVEPAGVKRDPMNPYITTISVFEGRNHLIRRIIGYFGADVTKLVRTRYAGLTDKGTRTGRWRYLKQKEINDLRRLVKLDTLAFNKES